MDSSDLSDGPITLQEYLEVKKALASSEAKVQQLMKVNNNLSEELRRLQKEVHTHKHTLYIYISKIQEFHTDSYEMLPLIQLNIIYTCILIQTIKKCRIYTAVQKFVISNIFLKDLSSNSCSAKLRLFQQKCSSIVKNYLHLK